MPDIGDFLRAIKDGVKELIARTLSDHKRAAAKDAAAFLKRARVDLERWVWQYATGALTRDEFEFLVRGQNDLADMEALKQAGLTLARLDQFRASLFDLVIGTAVKMFRVP